MQSVLSRNWTRIAVSISIDDNHYTTGTSLSDWWYQLYSILSREHPNYRITQIGKNTKKSPGDLRWLAFTQTFVKDHQLTLVVWISERKLHEFYHLGHSEYCPHLYCYIHNDSADVSSSILQAFLVKLRSLYGTSNHVPYLIHESCLL